MAYWKKSYTPTGIEQLSDRQITVYSKKGQIVVEGAKSEVTVYDLWGRKIEQIKVNSDLYISRFLKSGIYIVTADEQARKVYVR